MSQFDFMFVIVCECVLKQKNRSTVESLKDGHTIKRTLTTKRMHILPQFYRFHVRLNFIDFMSDSSKSNLCKVDTSIKLTLFYGSYGVRIREIQLYL